MKNRAKCKLCQAIIESFYEDDYVICKCGEISVDKGAKMHCAAKNWSNFVRVDDKGNEIVVTVKDEIDDLPKEPLNEEKPTKEELLKMLSYYIEDFEKLPPNAMSQPITHYDLVSPLLLIQSLFKVL